VRALFARHDVDLHFWRETNPWRFASVEAFVTFFEQRYGPMIKARERLEADGTWAVCREELVALCNAFNHATRRERRVPGRQRSEVSSCAKRWR
jgi:hypothetical protein